MNCGGMRTIYRPTQSVRSPRKRRIRGVSSSRDPGSLRPVGSSQHCVIVLHVVVVPYGMQIVSSEGGSVNHPPECLRDEATARCVTLFLCCDSQRTEHRLAIPGFVPAFLLRARRDAPIHVTMPARDAQRDALVEVVLRRSLRRCIHGSDQAKLSLRVFLV